MLTPNGSGIEPEEVSHMMEVVFEADEAACAQVDSIMHALYESPKTSSETSLSYCASAKNGGQK